MLPRSLRTLSFLLVAAVSTATAAVLLRAAAQPAAPASTSLDQALTGVWMHVGKPGHVTTNPPTDAPLKFRIGQRWTYTRADPSTGTVTAHFGGTYRVTGNDYVETITYSTDSSDPELGKSLTFTVKIEGDLMTQTGLNNPYTEVWKRVR